MYAFQKRHFVSLLGSGTPAGATIDIPLVSEEPIQYLTCWIYTAGQVQIPDAQAVLVRNGIEVGDPKPLKGEAAYAFPVYIYSESPEFELGVLYPPVTSTSRPVDSVFKFDAATGVFVEYKDSVSRIAVPAMPLLVRITNLDTAVLDLVVMWSGQVWRNA